MKFIYSLALVPLVLVQALTAQSPAPVKKPGDAVTLAKASIKGEVKPGAKVTAVVQFKIDAGYHVQANPTSEPNFIPVVLKLDPAAGLVWSPPTYPASKEEKVDGLDKPLKVYDGSFEILVPIQINADAKLPVVITGVLSYQACKGAVCYAPKKLKLEIPVAAK
jgi:Disulphide bond corrector protein DsbC